ncbi:DJ-1/PfpI family protein [Thalassobacillus hwangdonensis]|uniref:DJ-1/PfpI family protein n=1 Tax=Thalassobacillus hwangdonensis TaxID=546108 RepID=A0ABW3L5B2_9BACI
MKKVLLLVFPQYADFELGHPLFVLRKIGEAQITTVSADGANVESLGGMKTQVDGKAADFNAENFDLVLIPGGDDIDLVLKETTVITMLNQAYESQVPVASICASATLLAKAGMLKGHDFTCMPGTYEHFNPLFEGARYSGAPVEVGDTWITAKGTAYAEFAIAIGEMLDLFDNEDHKQSILHFCKGVVSTEETA